MSLTLCQQPARPVPGTLGSTEEAAILCHLPTQGGEVDLGYLAETTPCQSRTVCQLVPAAPANTYMNPKV